MVTRGGNPFCGNHKTKHMQEKAIIKRHANYVEQNRHWVSVKRHTPVVLKSITLGIFFSIVQYFIKYKHLSFEKEAENAILFIPVAFSFFVYVIFAGYAISRVLDESKEVSQAIIKKDLDTFLTYRDEQLPILVHLPLGSTASIIILFTLFFPFPSESIALTSVFSLVFTMTLLFFVTQELDNYENSIWFKQKTPKEWWQIDIDKHFEKKSDTKSIE